MIATGAARSIRNIDATRPIGAEKNVLAPRAEQLRVTPNLEHLT
jgi:hypothetical protein